MLVEALRAELAVIGVEKVVYLNTASYAWRMHP